MPTVNFYHLSRRSVEEALPALVNRVLASGQRLLIHTANPAFAKFLDDCLWTFDSESFLPHASAGSSVAPALEPVWITADTENPNGATVLLLADQTDSVHFVSMEKVLIVFHGRHRESLDAARRVWKLLKEAGHTLRYFQENEEGGWLEKVS
ncbi:MAG: DNA polymerase III subunit chi [Holosporales bacterium]|jgi:DNA polymerase-3 subunit chi